MNMLKQTIKLLTIMLLFNNYAQAADEYTYQVRIYDLSPPVTLSGTVKSSSSFFPVAGATVWFGDRKAIANESLSKIHCKDLYIKLLTCFFSVRVLFYWNGSITKS